MDAHESMRGKVKAVFRELVGDRVDRLLAAVPPSTEVMASVLSTHFDTETSKDIAFHLADWSEDAAFLVALHLFPERFTPEEVEAGIGITLVHAPNHLAAAAKLWGQPIYDVFEVGPLVESDS